MFLRDSRTRALQSHDLSGERINSRSHTYFYDHTRTWRASLDEGSAQYRSHFQDNTDMKDDTQWFMNQFNLTRRIWKDDCDGQMIFGDLVGLKLPDICLTGEEKSRKNLTQETFPDRGPNPVPLRDRCACYRQSHSGGLYQKYLHERTGRVAYRSFYSDRRCKVAHGTTVVP